jgi:hypothetical protein
VHHTRDTTRTIVVVVDEGHEAVVGHVPERAEDIALLEALACLALAARSGGWSLRVRDPSSELRELVELAGLTRALGVEPSGEPELLEQLGPEEVVEPGDPPV